MYVQILQGRILKVYPQHRLTIQYHVCVCVCVCRERDSCFMLSAVICTYIDTDLDPGIEPRSPTLQEDSLLSEPPGKPPYIHKHIYVCVCVYMCVCVYTSLLMR